MEENQLRLPILGMKSEACAAAVERALEGNPAVAAVSVDLANGSAAVTLDSKATDLFEITSSIHQLGYEVEHESVILPVEGMSCVSCVIHVQGALEDSPGVIEARVDLASQQAKVSVLAGQINMENFRTAVEDAGYRIRPE